MKTLIEVVKGFIGELMEEQMAATVDTHAVQCFFPCPKCSNLHIEVEMVVENSEVFCTMHQKSLREHDKLSGSIVTRLVWELFLSVTVYFAYIHR